MEVIKLATVNLPSVRAKRPGSHKWHPFGDDNLFPQRMIEYATYSATHQAILNLKTNLCLGDGFMAPEDNPELAEAIKRFNPSEDASKTAYKLFRDLNLIGSWAIQVLWDKTGTRPAEFRHMDVSCVRAAQLDEYGEVVGYYYSRNWANPTSVVGRPKFIPSFNPEHVLDSEGNLVEPRQLLYFTAYEPGTAPYGHPSYVSALQDIYFDYLYGRLKANTMLNGMFGGMHVHVTNPTAGQPIYDDNGEDTGVTKIQLLERVLTERFSGVDNAQKLFVTWSETTDQQTTITPIQTISNADLFTAWSADAKQNIISAHQLSSPVLAGLPGAGSLGGNSNEISVAQRFFLNTVIRPMQNQLIETISMLLELKYGDLDTSGLSISNSEPVFSIPDWATDVLSNEEVKYILKEHFGIHLPEPEPVVDEPIIPVDPASPVAEQPAPADAVTRQLVS